MARHNYCTTGDSAEVEEWISRLPEVVREVATNALADQKAAIAANKGTPRFEIRINGQDEGPEPRFVAFTTDA